MKKYVQFLLLVVIAFILASPHVGAKGDLSVQYRFGADNRVIPLETVPVYVDITNTGKAFSGDFVYDNEEIYTGGTGIVIPFDIDGGETISLKFTIHSMPDYYVDAFNIKENTFIYEGGIEKGKKVAIDVSTVKGPKILNYEMQRVLVISNNTDIPSLLKSFSGSAFNNLEITQVTPDDTSRLTNYANDFNMYKTMIIDESGAKALTTLQAKAIEKWMRQGGKLVVTGNVAMEALPEVLSFEGENATVINSSSKPLTLANGLVVAQMAYGNGEITQASLGFENEKFVNSPQVELILANMLQSSAKKSEMNMSYRANDWSHTNGYFDTFHYNTTFIVLFLLLYIVIIGPLLYTFLKRKDKREKMWLYIPVIAVVSSSLLFVFGASDRLLKPQTQTMELVSLNGVGDAQIDTAYAFVSNKRGDYEISAPIDTNVAANFEHFNSPDDSIHKYAYTQANVKEQLLTLRDVPYWSVQGAVATSFAENIGTLDHELKLENGKLTGTITNALAVDIENVMLLTGKNVVEFGPVKAGDTITIGKEVKFTTLSKPYYENYSSNEDIYNGLSAKEEMHAYKTNAIIQNAVNHSESTLLVATSNTAYSNLHLQGRHSTNVLSVITQTPQIKTVLNGKFLIHSDDFEASTDNHTNVYTLDLYREREALYGTMFEGDYMLDFTLPKGILPEKTTWSELEVTFDQQELSVELLNSATNKFEPIPTSPWRSEQDIANYVSDKQSIQFKISTYEQHYGVMLKMPIFKLRGEASYD